MPYLKGERRQFLAKGGLTDLLNTVLDYGFVAGDLNYIICSLADIQAAQGDVSYEKLRNILAEIHEAEEEIRRRLLVPYEAKKRHENGDVFFSDVRCG